MLDSINADVAFDCTVGDTHVRDIVIEYNRLESHFRMHNTKDGLV